MAKPGMLGMVEKHVEKGVLALSVLILLYVVMGWMVSSPREIEISVVQRTGPRGQSVTPSTIDEALAESASNLDAWAEDADVDAPQVREWDDLFRRLAQQPFDPDLLSIGVLAAGDRWMGIETPREPNKVTLAAVRKVIPAPPQPRVRAERELRNMSGAEDVVAAHVLTIYPLDELKQQWSQLLQSTPILVHNRVGFYRVEAEVQQMQDDGTWGPARAVDAVVGGDAGETRRTGGRDFRMPTGADRMPIDRRMQPGMMPTRRSAARPVEGQLPVIPAYDGTNAQVVNQAIDNLLQPQVQASILHPGYWPIWWPEGLDWINWRVNLPENPVSSREMARMREAGYESETRVIEREGPPRLVPTRNDRTPSRRNMRPPEGMDPRMMRDGRQPGRQPGRPIRRPTPPTRRTPGREATLEPTVEQEVIEVPDPKPVPAIEQQFEQGQVMVWLHDTTPQAGRKYRYRIRMVFISPVVTYAQELQDPNDAARPTVASEWSSWSQPVFVPHPTRFFVTGAFERRSTAKVTVFKPSLGQWVSEVFSVVEGEPIGGRKRVQLINPISREVEERTVDFSTGTMVVGLDFGKKVQKRGGLGERETLELLFLDDQGSLASRVQEYDQDSQEYKDLREKAERVAEAVKAYLAEQGGAVGLR